MDPESTYRTALRSLVARFRWGLLTESAWIAAARQINPEPGDDRAARRACLTIYSRTLHEACQDRGRQDQAYRELFDYLYPQAFARDANIAFEATQDAIGLAYRSFTEQKLTKCQQPEAFLCFAQDKLRDAFKRIYQRRKRENGNVSLDSPSGDDDQGDGSTLPEPAHQMPGPEPPDSEREEWVAAMVYRVAERVLHCLGTLWQQRSLNMQVRILLLTFMDRAADAQIAAQLHKTTTAIHSLRTRALDKLRVCLNLHLPLSWGGEL
ncbi:hypothetical protein [Candidatus Amarolinea aalborgensis]|uniref:hypothetical protein n=1 Tax=Candidatus Amarolinea aalborgensis TaxID=2249329 RepID=UPI003BF981EC